MSKIVMGPELLRQFQNVNEQVEFCDQAGKTVGHFLPETLYQEMVNAYVEKVFPKSEVEEALRQSGGKTLKEIWRKLGRNP